MDRSHVVVYHGSYAMTSRSSFRSVFTSVLSRRIDEFAIRL